jgi:sortase A
MVTAGCILAAVGLLGYPVFTNVYQGRLQHRLRGEVASPERRIAYQRGQLETGDAVTRIRIDALGVDTVVVEGTTADALRAGAGHYPSTPLPCEDGNVGIAGHRTTYGKPFANVDRLKPGDLITLQTPVQTCTYAVSSEPLIVHPDGLLANGQSVLAGVPGRPMLTLTSCHPKGSAARRIIIQAALVTGAQSGA